MAWDADASEKVVCRIAAEEGLVARRIGKRICCSSCGGEIAEASLSMLAGELGVTALNMRWADRSVRRYDSGAGRCLLQSQRASGQHDAQERGVRAARGTRPIVRTGRASAASLEWTDRPHGQVRLCEVDVLEELQPGQRRRWGSSDSSRSRRTVGPVEREGRRRSLRLSAPSTWIGTTEAESMHRSAV